MLIQTLGRVCIDFVGIYTYMNNSATPRSTYKYRYLYQLSRLLKNLSFGRIRQRLGLKKPNLNHHIDTLSLVSIFSLQVKKKWWS